MASVYESECSYVPERLSDTAQEAMILRFRQGRADEAEGIWNVLQDGRRYLAEHGIDQWQNVFPMISDVQRDITLGHNWVLTLRYYSHEETKTKEAIIGTLVLFFDEDPTHASIYEGQWLHNDPAGTIHRVAIDSEYRGKQFAHMLFIEAYQLCMWHGIQHLRIDTHEGNKPMRSLVEHQGFSYRGKIITLGGEERLAFEKTITNDEDEPV